MSYHLLRSFNFKQTTAAHLYESLKNTVQANPFTGSILNGCIGPLCALTVLSTLSYVWSYISRL